MRRGQAQQLVRSTFDSSPVIWQGDGRHFIRPIESLPQAEAAALALSTPNDIAAFYAMHEADFGGHRPKYRGFIVHDKGGSIDGAILVERDGFCWRPLGVTWPRGRRRPTKGLQWAVKALCKQEGVCGVRPGHRGSVNRSTLGMINCTGRANYCGQAAKVVPMRPRGVVAGDRRTPRPTASRRRSMSPQLFALPKSAMSAANRRRLPRGVPGAYPMDSMPRARNARSRAIAMLNAGHLTPAEAQTIFDRTAAFSARMANQGVRGWHALEPRNVTGDARLAANLLPSRDRKGRFVPRRVAAPGFIDYPGGGGDLPSRNRRGRFVPESQRAPALGSSRRSGSAGSRGRTGWLDRFLGRSRRPSSRRNVDLDDECPSCRSIAGEPFRGDRPCAVCESAACQVCGVTVRFDHALGAIWRPGKPDEFLCEDCYVPGGRSNLRSMSASRRARKRRRGRANDEIELMDVGMVTQTDGGGLWSKKAAVVHVNGLALRRIDSDFGELRATFHEGDWDTRFDGLIYTDPAWIEAFRDELRAHGFSRWAADDLDYSEQGMQSDDFVSMDVGGTFIAEWDRLQRAGQANCGCGGKCGRANCGCKRR